MNFCFFVYLDPDLHGSANRIHFIRLDPDQGGRAKMTSKIKSGDISCFEVLDVFLLRTEGFSCSWDFLYEGLGMEK